MFDNFNFKRLDIIKGSDQMLDHGPWEKLTTANLCKEGTLDQKDLYDLSKTMNLTKIPKLYIKHQYYVENERQTW